MEWPSETYFGSNQKSEGIADLCLSTGIENVDETVERPKYRLISEPPTIYIIDPAKDENVNRRARQNLVFQDENYKFYVSVGITSNELRLAIIVFDIEQDWIWYDHHFWRQNCGWKSSWVPAFVIRQHLMIISVYVVLWYCMSIQGICHYVYVLASLTILLCWYSLERCMFISS